MAAGSCSGKAFSAATQSLTQRGCQRRSRWALPAGTGFRGVGGAAMFSKAALGTAETNRAQESPVFPVQCLTARSFSWIAESHQSHGNHAYGKIRLCLEITIILFSFQWDRASSQWSSGRGARKAAGTERRLKQQCIGSYFQSGIHMPPSCKIQL